MGLLANLAAAWRQLTGDPVGVLVPAGGALLLQLVGMRLCQALVGEMSWGSLLLAVAGIELVRRIAVAPLRALILRAGARVLERTAATGWVRGALSLAVIELVVGLVVGLVGAVIIGPSLFVAALLVARGAPTAAVIVAAAGALLALLLTLLLRALFAYAVPEAVIGGKGPIDALSSGFELGQNDFVALVGLLFAGDVILAVGTLPCAVGALPAYPIADLAVLSRWRAPDS